MICKLAQINDVSENKWYEYSLQVDDKLTSVMLYKSNGTYTAYINMCPHQGRRMDYAQNQFLISENGNIICPAHGAEFNFKDGQCISGPCLGQSLQTIHIQLNEDSIFAIIQ